ncbi:MAG TPA: glycosyltransferase family 4 protein [Solirubrobacterales bacterium]|jgi:glycosyltransferase involved in cell wall biosynthesis|nr:glycosyltransferase family 4 protein [Solirubrobacterales bacterium]
MTAPSPLRVLFLDEGILGGRTLMAQLRYALGAHPEIEARFMEIPPANRLERLLLRRSRRLGDADLHTLRWRLRWSWRARRILKRQAKWADVALVNTQASALLSRGPMRRLPCVLSIDASAHQYEELEYGRPRDRWSPVQERMAVRLERRAIGGAAKTLAWTEWTAAGLRSEYDLPEEELATIHPGLDLGWWSAAAASRAPRDDGILRILFVGNDTERKGLTTLLAAVARLGGEAHLDVVTGEEVEEAAWVHVHHGVEPRSERLRELYAGADAFALPTRADCVPWVVLEAMAAGLPVVASRVGAIEEMVGDAGELVKPDDVDAVEAALRRLADPLRRAELAARATARVRDQYDSATQTPRLLAMLREAAGETDSTGKIRMRRRTFVALGAGVAAVAIAAPYAVLLSDDEFERLVASRLGIEPKLAGQLLERARAQYGGAEYDARAAAFALAVREPVSSVLPSGARDKAIDGLIEPMLAAPAAVLAYTTTGSDPGSPACAGLTRAPA